MRGILAVVGKPIYNTPSHNYTIGYVEVHTKAHTIAHVKVHGYTYVTANAKDHVMRLTTISYTMVIVRIMYMT